MLIEILNGDHDLHNSQAVIGNIFVKFRSRNSRTYLPYLFADSFAPLYRSQKFCQKTSKPIIYISFP